MYSFAGLYVVRRGERLVKPVQPEKREKEHAISSESKIVYDNNPTDLFYVQDSGKQIYDQKYLIHPAKGTVGTDGYERVVFQKRHYSYGDGYIFCHSPD